MQTSYMKKGLLNILKHNNIYNYVLFYPALIKTKFPYSARNG